MKTNFRVKKRLVILSVTLIFLSLALEVYAGTLPPGPGTANSPGSYNDPNGSLTQTQSVPFQPYNGSDNAQTHTISFDVLGIEQLQPPSGVVFNVTTIGSLTVTFLGSKPTVTCTFCSKSYTGATETVSYTGGKTDVLTVVWSTAIFGALEPKRVLLIDDFLTGPSVDSKWIIDQYAASGSVSGIYSQAGYMVMQAKSTSTIESAHVVSPAFSPGVYNNATLIKRKLTVALYPFQKKESLFTATLHIGLSSLLSTGAFPGNTPQNTPTASAYNDACNNSPTANDNIGSEYFYLNNAGEIDAVVCGDPSGTLTDFNFGTMDPTRYTVLTVETAGIFCQSCADNVFVGSSWVWFRVYQEDANSNIIASTDKNVNDTSGIAPYFQTVYTFVSEHNSNSAATFQTSYIDLVQLQNYGSPVCLFGCIPPLVIEGLNYFSSLWASLVGFCLWIGNGDLGFGALMLFGLLSAIILGSTYFIMRKVEGASTLALVIEFMALSGVFITSGLMGSIWVFVIIIADALVAFITFRSIFFSGSRGGSVQSA